MKDVFLLGHFVGLIIGAGTAFALFAISYLAPKFPAAARREVLMQLFPLRYISYVGLLLLIASGIGLIIPMEAAVRQAGFIIKMVFVAVIVAASIFGTIQMRRARRSADNDAFRMLGYAGKVSFASSMAVVVCAVYTFH